MMLFDCQIFAAVSPGRRCLNGVGEGLRSVRPSWLREPPTDFGQDHGLDEERWRGALLHEVRSRLRPEGLLGCCRQRRGKSIR